MAIQANATGSIAHDTGHRVVFTGPGAWNGRVGILTSFGAQRGGVNHWGVQWEGFPGIATVPENLLTTHPTISGDVAGSFGNGLGEGEDLRDRNPSGILIGEDVGIFDPGNGFGDGFGDASPAAAVGIVGLALRMLAAVAGRGARITRLHWSRLPGWAQAALSGAGIVVGSIVGGEVVEGIMDSDSNGRGNAEIEHIPLVPGGPDVGHPGIDPSHHAIGSWVANGVTFYRLADGRLAVQNLKGRWKVWKPKKPIVMYSDGASSLKTFLRADRALDKQAKRLAKALNRRAPRSRRSQTRGQDVIVAAHSVPIASLQAGR